ncbi:MAG: protein O-mannosyl-transferase family [Bdellovibrionia bacterium]
MTKTPTDPRKSTIPVPPLILSPRLTTALPALSLFILALPLLARVPISGDGAEFVVVAQQGGVLHPPGFPVQAWLNRIWIHLPFWNGIPSFATPTWRLSLLSLIGHAGSVFLLCDTLRLLQVPLLWIWLGSLAFGALPATLHSGVQPEVFAWSHFLMAAAFHQAARLQRPGFQPAGFQEVCEVGCLGALCLAQHLITVVTAPIFLASTWMIWSKTQKSQRLLRFGQGSTVFLLLLIGAYLSLLALRTQSPWPDWGVLQTASDLVRHFTRSEFGIFSLSPNAPGSGDSALSHLMTELASNWNLALIAIPPGFVWALTRRTPFSLGLLGSLGAALLFLSQAESFGQEAYDFTLIERFLGTGVLPLALLLGLSGRKLSSKWNWLAALGLISIGCSAVLNLARIDASSEFTMQAYREAIAQDLPNDALYLSAQSEEYFAGIPTPQGLRFPIQKGAFLNHPWYVESTLPRLEPNLPHKLGITTRDLVESALALGRPVVSPDEAVFKSLNLPAELHGILWYAPAQPNHPQTEKTLESAIRICPLLHGLHPLPLRGHGYAHQLRKYFARAYSHAEAYLQIHQNTEGARAAHALMDALLGQKTEDQLQILCEDFKRTARSSLTNH